MRHFTSDPTSIPAAYRAGARDIGSPRPREAPAVEPPQDGAAGIMRFEGGAPIVAPVVINGVGLRFMVDTGADRTMISRAAAARAGLPVDAGRQVRIVGVAGTALASEVPAARVEVAGAAVGPLRLIVHDTPGDHHDGLLGRDVLDRFTLTVDGSAGRATLTPR